MKNMQENYQKLEVWKKSMDLVEKVYQLVKKLPKEEMYALTNQIRRAATSIPLNIAEGYSKRESQAEFKRFLMMAMGSSDEVQVLLRFAKDLGYITEEEYTKGYATYKEISKMLNGMLRAVKSEL